MTVKNGKNGKHYDYDAFVEKFKPKKTTDDCYTPPEVYDIVLKHVRETYHIADDVPIVRPFYPGGDYENYDYPEGCVVVDNPPFSIFAKILDFYTLVFCSRFVIFRFTQDRLRLERAKKKRAFPLLSSRLALSLPPHTHVRLRAAHSYFIKTTTRKPKSDLL